MAEISEISIGQVFSGAVPEAYLPFRRPAGSLPSFPAPCRKPTFLSAGSLPSFPAPCRKPTFLSGALPEAFLPFRRPAGSLPYFPAPCRKPIPSFPAPCRKPTFLSGALPEAHRPVSCQKLPSFPHRRPPPSPTFIHPHPLPTPTLMTQSHHAGCCARIILSRPARRENIHLAQSKLRRCQEPMCWANASVVNH